MQSVILLHSVFSVKNTLCSNDGKILWMISPIGNMKGLTECFKYLDSAFQFWQLTDFFQLK